MFTRVAAISAAVGLSALLGVTAWVALAPGDSDRYAQCRASTVAGGGATIGGPFTLVNSDGQTVTDADVITEPTLVYFGYTFCPDVCPLDNARNAEAVYILEEQGLSVTPVFISVDPDRDTPEVLGDFVGNFHDRMIGLTGSAEQVKAASLAYKTYYRIPEDAADDPYYLVDHSTFTYLVLPEVGFVEFFRRDDTAEQMAERVACFAQS